MISGNSERNTEDVRLKNLRPPWPKGTSGNPSGRPRRDYVSRHLQQMLDLPEGNPKGRQIAEILIELALKKKNLAAIREILDRVEGKAATLIGGLPDEPIEFNRDETLLGLTHEEKIKKLDEELFELLNGVYTRGGFRLVRVPAKKREKKDDS